MAKNASNKNAEQAAPVTQFEFASVRDFAANQAGHVLSGMQYARWAEQNIAGFPDNVTKETMEEVQSGYLLKYTEYNPNQRYIREDSDRYVPLTGEKPEGKEVLEIGAAFAMSYTSQQFGALRKDTPNLHGIVKEWREKFSKYSSNAWNNLLANHRKLHAVPQERGVNKDFLKYLEETLSAMETRNKTALSRGDGSAIGTERLKYAIAQFWAGLKPTA